MKQQLFRPFLSAVLVYLVCATSISVAHSKNIEIKSAKFEFPNPAFPYYHFVVEANLSNLTYVDATVRVNDRELRFT